MRKQVFGRQLSRGRGGREALFRSLVASLVARGTIVTTLAKAKAVAPRVDKLLGLVKANTLASRKRVLADLGNNRETAEILFTRYAPAVAQRQSGFTRIVKLSPRRGDMAAMARLEMVDKAKEIKEQNKEQDKQKEKPRQVKK